MLPHRLRAAATCALLGLGFLAACTDNNATGTPSAGASADPRALSVRSTDTTCELSATTAPSGTLTFTVTNAGSTVTEFYLYAGDGQRVVAEVENIGPGLTRDLVVKAAAGDYLSACKPGMTGDGIRAPFTVSASDQEPAEADDAELAETAVETYHGYVEAQAEELAELTADFVGAYKAGEDAKARDLYPRARVHWERIEPVAESFGDLDPKLDLREADLEPGQTWTGWHLLEKDLWPARAKDYTALTAAERTRFADELLANTRELEERVEQTHPSVDQIANGARELLDEVATTKVTGEEEYWSRTDLWDFDANVDGAYEAYEALRPLLQRQDAELDHTLHEAFEDLQDKLATYEKGGRFVSYDTLTAAQVKELSDAVNTVAEPLSRLTAAVV